MACRLLEVLFCENARSFIKCMFVEGPLCILTISASFADHRPHIGQGFYFIPIDGGEHDFLAVIFVCKNFGKSYVTLPIIARLRHYRCKEWSFKMDLMTNGILLIFRTKISRKRMLRIALQFVQ